MGKRVTIVIGERVNRLVVLAADAPDRRGEKRVIVRCDCGKGCCAMSDLPRVSTILKVLDDAYEGVPKHALEKAAERGTQLHRLCLTYLASLDGVHEEPAVGPAYEPAYQAFVKWCEDNAVLVVAIEERSASKTHGYTGTPDALVIVRGEEWLIDLKFTAAIMRTNRVQIQAYARLDEYKTAKKLALILINPVTGDMKVHPVKKNPSDWCAFLNALSVWKWRMSK